MSKEDPNAVITECSSKAKSEICEKTVDMFVSAYGAEAGNMALRAVARGGIYLGGGIAPKILPALKWDTFLEAFRDKEHLRPLLSSIPVWVILNPRTGLLGAARPLGVIRDGLFDLFDRHGLAHQAVKGLGLAGRA